MVFFYKYYKYFFYKYYNGTNITMVFFYKYYKYFFLQILQWYKYYNGFFKASCTNITMVLRIRISSV